MAKGWFTVKRVTTMLREVWLDSRRILLQRIEEDGRCATVESKVVEDCETMAKNRKSFDSLSEAQKWADDCRDAALEKYRG